MDYIFLMGTYVIFFSYCLKDVQVRPKYTEGFQSKFTEQLKFKNLSNKSPFSGHFDSDPGVLCKQMKWLPGLCNLGLRAVSARNSLRP